MQVSRFVFYRNRDISINLSKLYISGELHVKPPKRIRGREDAKYPREPNLAVCLRKGYETGLKSKKLTALSRVRIFYHAQHDRSSQQLVIYSLFSLLLDS